MATQNLLDVIKAWPQKQVTATPKKAPEVFVPSKISEAPKKKLTLVEAMKESLPLNVMEKTWFLDVAKESTPTSLITNQKVWETSAKIMDYIWTKAKQTETILAPKVKSFYNKADPVTKFIWQKLLSDVLLKWGSQVIQWATTWVLQNAEDNANKVAEWKISEKEALTNLYWNVWLSWLSISNIPTLAISTLVKWWLEASWTKEDYEKKIKSWTDVIEWLLVKHWWLTPESAKVNTDTALKAIWLITWIKWAKTMSKTVPKTWNIIKDTVKNSSKIIQWALEQNAPDVLLLALWLAKEWKVTNEDLKNLWIWLTITTWLWAIWPNWIKEKVWETIWKYAEKQWLVSTLMPKDNKTNVQNIIPDNKKMQLSDAELDKQISEKKSKTTTIKSTPELVKEYAKAKKEQPDLTLEQFKQEQKDLSERPQISRELTINEELARKKQLEWKEIIQQTLTDKEIKPTLTEVIKEQPKIINLSNNKEIDIKTPAVISESNRKIWYNEAIDLSKNTKWFIDKNNNLVNKWEEVIVEVWPWWWEFIKWKLIDIEYNTSWKDVGIYWNIDINWKKQKFDWYYITKNKDIVQQPKIELPKQVTSMKWIDESIDKNILDIETKTTKWPVLEDWVYKIAVTPEKLSQLTRWTLSWDEWIQWFGNYARKSTDVSYWDPTKLTYNVYFKKKPESDLWWTDFKFWDIKIDEVVWIEKRTDKPTTKIETPLIEEIKKQPKVEKTKKSATQRLSDLQKQKTDLEKRVKNKPQLQRVLNQVNKKISDLESKIKEQPQRLQKYELFPEEVITPKVENIVNPTQRVREKLTKKRAKEIKKAIFDELAERRKIRADKIKQEQNIIKTEEQKIKQNQELIQDNRRKELEEIYLKTDNSKYFEDIVYNDNILSDDNKIKLLEDIQWLETMSTWKSNIEIKKEWTPETGDIFATAEERAAKVEKENVLKNTNKLITETKLTWDTKIKLTQEMIDSLKKWDTSNILYKDILEQNQWVDFKVWDEVIVKNTLQIKDYLKKNKIENTSESYDLELVPWTFELLTRNINLDTFLNNIIIKKWKDSVTSWNTYVQWLKSLWKQVANQLYKDFWLGNIFDKSNFSKYKTSINDSFKNLEKDLDTALIGWKTANEEIPITNDNYKTIKETLLDWWELDFRDTFWTIDWSIIQKFFQLDYFRRLHKWNQEIIDKYIPKDLQEIMTKVEDSNARLLYDTTWEKMVWDWLLDKRWLAENYSKFLLIPESRKRFETDVTWWKSLFTTSDWMQFDSLAEMQTYIKRSKDLYWRELTPEFDVWKLSSLTKEKTTWDIDLYRFNSPSAQAFAYMRDVWDIYKTDSVFQFFNKVDKSKNVEVSNLKDTLFNSSIFQNAIEQVLNLEKKSKWFWWIAKTWIQKITKWSQIAALYWNIKNFVQATTYWTLRNTITGWNLNMFRWLKLDDNSKNILRKWGITQPFEVTSVKDIWTNKTVSFFSWTPIENINKTWAAIPIIKSHLKMNWYDISKMDNNQLFQAFDDFMINWDQKLKLQAKDDIYRATNYIWNTNSTSRNSIWLFNDLWFTSLKTFQTDAIWQSYQQIRNTFLGWTRESKLKSWWKFIAPKLAKYWLTYIIAQQIYEKAKEEWEEMTEEMSKAIANNITTQMFWDDIVNLKSALIWVFSNAWNIAPWILKDFIEATMIAYKWEWKTWLQYAVNSLLNKTAIWRNINAITKIATWKETKESLAEILKTPSFIWQNTKWVATWNQIDSRFEAAMEVLWYGWDSTVRNYLFEQIDKAKIDIENPEMSETWKIALRFTQNTYKQMWRDIENLYLNTAAYKNIWEYTDWAIDKQYVVNTLNEIEWSKSLNELLTKLWITTQISNDILKATWKSAETIISENDNVEKIINQYLSTNEIPANLTLDEKLKFMQENNPVLFNKFISGLARTKRYLNENEDIDITNKSHIDKITGFFKTSTNQIDAAIADYTDTKSITTDIAEIMDKNIMDLSANIWKVDWLNKTKAQLQEIENVLKMFKDNWLVTSWMVDSLSLKAFEMSKKIWELEKKWYTTFVKDFPVISEYVKKWLYLRWEKDFINTNIKPNIWQKQWYETITTSGDDLKQTILNAATWYSWQDKKKKKTELPLLKVEKAKTPQPLFKITKQPTLAEILLKK